MGAAYKMQIYLVGGAVRDQLLKIPVTEKDWVVVGATPKQLLDLGYTQVGKDFPVFLHPKTHEEYALARTERKTKPGYHGFNINAAPDVTLEQDLKRRDLTINAIAQDSDHNLIDPYNGQQDIKNHIFRHVSPAFSEDPVRILRVARFSARLSNFTIAKETMSLMEHMVDNGEVASAAPDRIWQETVRALKEKCPWRYFEVLQQTGALKIIMPELTTDSVNVTRLKKICAATKSPAKIWALVLYKISQTAAKKLCLQLRVPKAYTELTLLTSNNSNIILNAMKQTPEVILNTLMKCDALRREERFNTILETISIIGEETAQKDIELIKTIAASLKKMSVAKLISQGLQGADLAEKIKKERLSIIQQSISDLKNK